MDDASELSKLKARAEASYADHLSYICFFFSYAVGSPLGYRLLAIVACVFEIFSHAEYDSVGSGGGFSMRVDAIPVGYSVLFVVINGTPHRSELRIHGWLLGCRSSTAAQLLC